MRKKIVASVLTVAFLTTSFISNGAVLAAPYTQDKKAGQLTEAQINLQEQLGNDISGKKYKMLFSLNDEVMKNKYHLHPVPVEDRNEEHAMAKQIAYADSARKHFAAEARKLGVNLKFQEIYDASFTGFAAEVTAHQGYRLAGMPEINAVEINIDYKAPKTIDDQIYHELDHSSNKMVFQNHQHNTLGEKFNGQGRLIAVIDSGADPDHEAFKNSVPNPRIKDKDELAQLIKKHRIRSGQWFSEKIPFGFNYVDNTSFIKESVDNSHGMHVAGIIAADSKNGNMRGVAPKAQLVIMRVFGSSFGGTDAITYSKAIDDAVKLNVDAINMSIGAPARAAHEETPVTDKMLQAAKRMGIVVAIAGGNEGYLGFGAIDHPSAKNPDTSMLGIPAALPLSLAVASVENEQVGKRGFYMVGDEEHTIEYQDSGLIAPIYEEKFKVMDGKKGTPTDLKDFKDQNAYALIERGDADKEKGDSETRKDFNFIDKINNAAAAGAIGVIVYNNKDDKEEPPFIMRADRTTIPSVMISKTEGQRLLQKIKQGNDVEIIFSKKVRFSANNEAGQMSTFSSWGLSAEGELKPEISAPGGKVYSTLNSNRYGSMSGTSMASPHVAAGIALVRQRVEEDFPDVTGSAKYQLIKQLLMSSAEPYTDKDNKAYISPRKQGAGLMRLDRALVNQAIFTDEQGQHASVNLGKDMQGNKVVVKGLITNKGSKPLIYNVRGVLNTDTVKDSHITLKPSHIMDSEIQSVRVEPRASRAVTVEMTVAKDKLEQLGKEMSNGFFLEGYVVATPEDEKGHPLVLPFVGFHGTKDNQNMDDLTSLEKPIYDFDLKNEKPMYYKQSKKDVRFYTHLSTFLGKNEIALGELPESTHDEPKFDKKTIAFSPNKDGFADSFAFKGVFLRNFEGFIMEIQDQQGKVVARRDNPKDTGYRNFVNPLAKLSHMLTVNDEWGWNGYITEDGSLAPEGSYNVIIKTKAPSSKKYQQVTIPIKLDRTFPRIVQADFSEDRKKFIISELKEEGGAGMREVYLSYQGKKYPFKASLNDTHYEIDLIEPIDPKQSTLHVVDQAYNDVTMPLEEAVRKGTGHRLEVQGLVGNEKVNSNDFTWCVVHADGVQKGHKADPYALQPGNYRLVVTDVSAKYNLSKKEIEFTVEQGSSVTKVDVPFQDHQLFNVTLDIDNPSHHRISLYVENVKNQRRFTADKQEGTVQFHLPQGTYSLVVNGIPNESYVALDGNDTFSVHGDMVMPVKVSVHQMMQDKVCIKVNRHNYQGPLTVVLTGKDVERQVQTIEIPEKQKEVYANIDFIPSEVSIKNQSNGHYSVDKVTWKAPKPGLYPTIVLDLKYKDEISSEFINYAEFRSLVAEYKSLNKAEDNMENPDIRLAWQYLDIFVTACEDALRYNRKHDQNDINIWCSNLREGLNNLKKARNKNQAGNLEKLRDAVDKVKDLENIGYTEDSWNSFQETLKEAQALLQSPNPLQDNIDRLELLLRKEVSFLELKDNRKPFDKYDLEQALHDARFIEKEKDKYIIEFYQSFKDAFEVAKKVNDNLRATEEDIKEAAEQLNKAREALKEKGEADFIREDIKATFERIGALETIKDDYTEKSWSDLTTLVDSYKKQIDQEKNVEELKRIFSELRSAENTLVTKKDNMPSDLDILRILIDYANTLQAEDFEKVSFKLMRDSMEKAKIYLESDAAQEQSEEIIQAGKELRGNIEALEKKKAEINLETELSGQLDVAIGAMQVAALTEADVLRIASYKKVFDSFDLEKSYISNEHQVQLQNAVDKFSNELQKKEIQEKIKQIHEAIAGLPEASSLLLQDELQIQRIRHEVEALSEEGKQELSQEDLSTLENAEKRMKELKAPSSSKEREEKPVPKKPDRESKKESHKEDNRHSSGSSYIHRETDRESVVKSSDRFVAPVQKKEPVENKKEDQPLPKPQERHVTFIAGYEDGSFRPDQAVKRAEMAAMLAGLVDGKGQEKVTFSDLATDAWYMASVRKMAGLGVLNGYEDGTFRPNKALTRAELVAILVKWQHGKQTAAAPVFEDVSQGHWAGKAISIAASKGWIAGVDSTHFAPERAVTRAEAIAMINRVINNKGVVSQTKQFIDLASNHPFYNDIMRAVK